MNKRDKALKLLEDLRLSRPMPLFENITKADRGIDFVIGYLSHNISNSVTAGDIARELNVSTARVATLLNKMSKQGLVVRETSKEDARKIIVKLTNKGLKKANENFEVLISHACHLIEEVGEDNLKLFIDISKKMKKVMEENENI